MTKVHTRLTLQTLLEEMLGTKNVYYQPPENIKMNYPAIRYSKSEVRSIYADNKRYWSLQAYDIVVISLEPDHPIIEKLLDLRYSVFDRHYVSDGLNHDIIRIFY